MPTLSIRLRFASMLAAGLVFAAAGAALAQPNFVPRDLTRGVSLAGGGGAAGDFDATSVSANPGGLPTLGELNVAFAASLLDREGAVRGGGGWGLFLGLPIPFPLRGEDFQISYGFGFESILSPDSWLAPPGFTGGGAHPQDASFLRNGLSLGTPRLSVGWMLGTLFWTSSPQRDSVTTHQVGLSIRPGRFAAAGLHVRDVFEPVGRVEGEKFARSYEGELLVRPLGDWRLEIGAGATVGEDDLVDLRGRALFRPMSGVTLYGAFESAERRFGEMDSPDSRDSRVTVGVSLDGIDSILGTREPSISASYGLLTSSKGARTYAGSSVLVRWTRERYPALHQPEHFESLVVAWGGPERERIARLVAIDDASRASDVAGVVLDLREGVGSPAAAEELRSAVARLRRRGKHAIAYLRLVDLNSLYAAAACDRVFIHPGASVRLAGPGVQLFFVADLLARLGVGVQVVQIGEYKSAGEPFTRMSSTPQVREQFQALITDREARAVGAIAAGRGLTPVQVRAVLDRTSVTAPEVVSLRLADGVLHPDELEGAVEKLAGRSLPLRPAGVGTDHPRQWTYPRIAVVYIAGEIVPGESRTSLLGDVAAGDAVADAIREARESADIRAIILRVASPGGQVEPSERIAREVELTRGVKPIFVSMGDVAASGGYMVSAHADRVFAEPSTITGSIGVIALNPNVGELMARIGVASETIQIGRHADAGSGFRPWTEEEVAGMRRDLDYTYRRFLGLVARGRHLAVDGVSRVGGGRIWSGAAAQSAGLVDELGGFLDALDHARRAAGISSGTEIALVEEPRLPRDLVRALAGQGPLGASAGGSLPPVLSRLVRAVPASLWWGPGVLARMPYAAPIR